MESKTLVTSVANAHYDEQKGTSFHGKKNHQQAVIAES